MIHLNTTELICLLGLHTPGPDVSTEHHIDCSVVNDSLATTGNASQMVRNTNLPQS